MKKAAVLFLCLCVLLCVSGCAAPIEFYEPGPSSASEGPSSPEASPEHTPRPTPEPTPVPTPTPEPTPDPRTAAVESLLAGMTLEEKVGQMFFVRCPGCEAAEKAAQYQLGGYILFLPDFKEGDGWLTAEALTEKLQSYQSSVKIPLLIGVDEEGGTVIRASRDPYLFDEPFWSPQDLYRAGGLELICSNAEEKSKTLLSYGINVNLAPVADLSQDPNDFIYDRTFGQDAEATGHYIGAVVETMKDSGIGSVLKHFPGYGNNEDTHTGIAIDDRPADRFRSEDFIPFKKGIEAGADSVLVSHNVVNSMDPDLPASLSPEIHRILREELGFTGVIMTDDLAMDAVAAYAGDGSAAVLAVLAGNDLIVTTDFEAQIPLVTEAVRSGRITQDIVDRAVFRVLFWKYDLGLIG